MINKIKEKVKSSKNIDEHKKGVILEKIDEWRNEDKAMALIPNLLMKYYEKDIKPILDELGLSS
ncbi:hypothetical protein C3L23_06440 [Nautilia sp. PV-1]|uniref:hypothetical protein n=1 Tax=Nautilia sp. PV-1 TaxID=2579250 RepID=UPI000FD9B8D0|nr:hypothetical protein [Nautilia sp. PV-1]AZV46920.1 hypothetical protein C3L23_06440 [Nautilia sp. PV-1]